MASTSAAAPVRRARAALAGWDGTESPWVLAAWAAAPWPIFSLVAALGVPGAEHVPAWIHGPLVLALVFGAMVLWTQRPDGPVFARWLASIVGTGLMGELLAGALTDVGRGGGLSRLPDGGRALAVWLVCVGVYEVAPIVAAASRLSRSEQRARTLDVGAHLVFLLVALGAYLWDPRWAGERWYVSPWMAAVIAFPFAAARCGPRRPAPLPAPAVREGVLWALAAIAWVLFAAFLAHEQREVTSMTRAIWRWGASPLEGVLWTLPALSFVLSISAAVILLARAWRVRRAPSGVVVGLGDGGITLERAGIASTERSAAERGVAINRGVWGGSPPSMIEEPRWVAIEMGPLPPEGSTVTLLGARLHPPDVGPFRDGAPLLRARRAWVGAPQALSRALVHRAAGWFVWAAACELGIWLRLW